MAEKNRVFFKSVEEAEANGYKRAGNCPPEEIPVQQTATKGTSATAPPMTPVPKTVPPDPVQLSVGQPDSAPTRPAGEVIGNKNSKKYHLQGCPGYNQVGEKNRVYFKTAAEAEAAGYTKAGNCPK